MRSRRLALVALGAALAMLGSLSGAVGLLSPPQSAPVGLSVYKQHDALVSYFEPMPQGYRSSGLSFRIRDGLGVAVAVPPGVETSNEQSFWASSSTCTNTPNWQCTTAGASGSFDDSAVSYDPVGGSVRFQQATNCGDVDVTFVRDGFPTLNGQQSVRPEQGVAAASVAKNTNAVAAGVVCDATIPPTRAFLGDSLSAVLTGPGLGSSGGQAPPTACEETGTLSGAVHEDVEPVVGEPAHTLNCDHVVPWERELGGQAAAWQAELDRQRAEWEAVVGFWFGQLCAEAGLCAPFPG